MHARVINVRSYCTRALNLFEESTILMVVNLDCDLDSLLRLLGTGAPAVIVDAAENVRDLRDRTYIEEGPRAHGGSYAVMAVAACTVSSAAFDADNVSDLHLISDFAPDLRQMTIMIVPAITKDNNILAEALSVVCFIFPTCLYNFASCGCVDLFAVNAYKVEPVMS